MNRTFTHNRQEVDWKKKNRQNLEFIISARLKLSSCQKKLESFGLSRPSIQAVKQPDFLRQYKSWSQSRQDLFIEELGGFVNKKKTRIFLENLLKENLIF